MNSLSTFLATAIALFTIAQAAAQSTKGVEAEEIAPPAAYVLVEGQHNSHR
jgi:hypothetical protein